MKMAYRYGQLKGVTFTLTRGEVEALVREHISKKGHGLPVPIGSTPTLHTPWYWEETWGDDDEPFLTVRQEFIEGMTETPMTDDAVDPIAADTGNLTTRDKV